MSSFILEVLSSRLLLMHHSESLATSSQQADSSPFDIKPTTVVSSANLMIVFVLWVGVQFWVYSEYNRGLSMQPCGAPVLRVRVVE